MPKREWRQHYCSRGADPATCCDIGGHSLSPIPIGFDDPRCTCPQQWKDLIEKHVKDKIEFKNEVKTDVSICR
jgi:hypothetical protein